MDSLCLQGRMGISVVVFFKRIQTSRRKALSISEKETFSGVALLKVCVALRLTIMWFIIIIMNCAYLHKTTKAKALVLSVSAGDIRLSCRQAWGSPQSVLLPAGTWTADYHVLRWDESCQWRTLALCPSWMCTAKWLIKMVKDQDEKNPTMSPETAHS